MKTLNYLIITLAVSILAVIAACKKELKGPDDNLSSLSSITLGTANSGTPYYTLDNTGKYLILFVRDLNYNNGVVQKINISGPIPVLEKTITILNTVPISADNVVVTDDNQFIGTFFNFGKPGQPPVQLIYKFDINLNITQIDSVLKSVGGNFGRTRLIKSGTGKITGVFSNKIGKRCYLIYKEMNENLNVLSSKIDSVTAYGANNISGTGLIKTSDGGYLYTADNSDTPYVNNIEMLLEKRDANFNLLWTVKYKPTSPNTAGPAFLNELNGKYYVYCANSNVPQSTFVLVYDLNGNLVQNTPLQVAGITLRSATTTEPMRMTENGEFLILAAARLDVAPNLLRGMIYRTDANLKVISSEVYGGKGVVGSLIKISTNKYLHFYLDNNFTPDNNLPRLVFRYLDAKGKVIE